MPASRLYLPKLESPPATVLDYLCARFPHIERPVWKDRMGRGLVTFDNGVVIGPDTPYRYGLTALYHREFPAEPEPPELERVIYTDAEIMVVDKPHGMPVTPAGEYVRRSLVRRLQEASGNASIAPLHRLDRDTAGLVLFSVNAASRQRYHALFAARTIEREYLAVGHVPRIPDERRWLVENRLDRGHPWFRQTIVEGAVNAVTEIELLEIHDSRGLFRLRPRTGRKHQLRIHMVSIGFPIVGDPVYPDICPQQSGDLPLQLLATRLSFIDPVTGAPRRFRSGLTLAMMGSASDCAG